MWSSGIPRGGWAEGGGGGGGLYNVMWDPDLRGIDAEAVVVDVDYGGQRVRLEARGMAHGQVIRNLRF